MQTMRALVTVLALLGAALALPVDAQTYPAKPVRLIIPFPPGGPTDILGRLAAHQMSTAWGVQVLPDNRPGASGSVGAEQCAKSPPDGYTMCIMSIAQAIAPSIYPK